MVRVAGVMAGMGIGWLLSVPLNQFLGGFFWLFNAGFNASTNRLHADRRACCLRISALVLLVYGGLLYLTYWGFTHTPTGFIPTQDKGYLLVNVQLPDSASVERTEKVMQQIEEIASKVPGRQAHGGASPASRSCSTPTRRTSARCT